MGVFESQKTFSCNPALINTIAEQIVKEYTIDGYECGIIHTGYGTQVSIRKGGMFKAALGLKTALNVTITPVSSNAIRIKAGVGIFEQQAIPTAIMLFLFWPVIVTQIWGLVQQSHLDDQVMLIAERTIAEASSAGGSSSANNTGSEQNNWDPDYGHF